VRRVLGAHRADGFVHGAFRAQLADRLVRSGFRMRLADRLVRRSLCRACGAQVGRSAGIAHLVAPAARDHACGVFGLALLGVVHAAELYARAQVSRRRAGGWRRRRRGRSRAAHRFGRRLRRRLLPQRMRGRVHSAALIANASAAGRGRRSLAYSRCNAGARSSIPIGVPSGVAAAAASTALRTPPP
jgi:hypothetical protein